MIHYKHCRALADLCPAKATQEELLNLADTVYVAVNGLRRTKQFSTDAIATSLVEAALPRYVGRSTLLSHQKYRQWIS